MSKASNDALRVKYTELIGDLLSKAEEDPLRTGTNEIAIPCVDDEGNDAWVVVTVKVPTGSRDGDPYDGYSMQEAYEIRLREKAEAAAVAAEKKARKIARDEKLRAAKKKEGEA